MDGVKNGNIRKMLPDFTCQALPLQTMYSDYVGGMQGYEGEGG